MGSDEIHGASPIFPPRADPPNRLRPGGGGSLRRAPGLGVSALEFKVSERESSALFVVENVFHAKGGPARHLHHDQDEWFYAVEGEFVVEIGDERMRLRPGDSVLGPRGVPHVWAFVDEGRGRMLIVFTPAGRMEAFFREVTRENAMPPQDPALWRAHGLELLGPPLPLS